MKRILTVAATVAAAATASNAGGIDRSGQSLGSLFEAGRYFELTFGFVSPQVDGTDVLGNAISNVSNDYTQLAFSYKMDLNEQWSFALNVDKPFGADLLYSGDPAITTLGGTTAFADSSAVTGILRYKINDNFSAHGGLRAQVADGFIRLSGQAYSILSGYNVTLESDLAPGYVVGVAYEQPEIALRVALTYNSKVTHDFASTESIGTVQVAPESVTEVSTPQSVNIDFQTGIAAETLVFGNVRWVDWSEFLIDPAWFTGLVPSGLISLEDTVTYTLGVGRRFDDTWSGSFSLTYEPTGTDPLVSPLAPTDGRFGATIGVGYTKDKMKVTGGVNYTWLGDAQPEVGTPDRVQATMADNTSVGVGIRVGWSF